jgi:hypothetical protein
VASDAISIDQRHAHTAAGEKVGAESAEDPTSYDNYLPRESVVT